MMRFALLLFLSMCAPVLALADSHAPLARAFDAMRAGDWTSARTIASDVSPIAYDLIEWHRLRAGKGTPDEVLLFLDLNPDWPGLDWLRQKSEPEMLNANNADILLFFKDGLPQTAEGAIAHARALKASGQTGSAEAGLVLAWRSMAIGPSTHEKMLAEYGALLKDHHLARLDMVLWKGWDSNIERMMSLVPEGHQKLARARMGLRERVKGIDALVASVPTALQDDPGLSYERFVWRARKGLTDDAIDLALSASKNAKTLGEPEQWADRRRSLSRQLMRNKEYKRAYSLASQHHLSEGSSFADLEWLSGYLALRYLNDPKRALGHFQAHQGAVVTPISRGRAGYWIGRAHEALGNASAAKAAFADGAEYQSSFYGLLAAERAGLPFDQSLAGQGTLPDWRQARFMGSSVFQAAVLALQAGELTLSERFFTHLTESLSPLEAAQLGKVALDLNEPHIAVMIGKRAASDGVTIAAPYYAVHDLAKSNHPIATEFALAIARRESEFDPVVVSGAGARGLMQVMPATAKNVANELGVDYSKDKLTADWRYNAQLGTAYLARLDEQFGGNPVMMAAGYNAGPGRPVRWMELYGDPRRGEIDVVDWIEHIPFRETRNYAMRVTESLPIYRARLGKTALPIPFSKELIQMR
ncbi:MAG: lytic transglycosylase domain-containing protein [Planktotalea sp.]|uniref:lytic transglycosylase domain-containing protein n=1 Tax=Planktotalea sp. TaxID=2029877 RepID=UPI003C726F34